MKILMSVNEHFINITPFHFFELVKQYDIDNSLSGFELCFDPEDKLHEQYLREFIDLAIKGKYLIQFHCRLKDIEYQKRYLTYINNITELLGYKARIVYHPLRIEDVEEDIEETTTYMQQLLKYIEENSFNIELSIENLNSIYQLHRLDKSHLAPILEANKDLKFTFDIEHEISNYGKITDLDAVLAERLVNIHISTFNYIREHQSLNDSDENKQKWIKALVFLKDIGYDNTISMEYDFPTMYGENDDEKLINFIKGAKYLNEYF